MADKEIKVTVDVDGLEEAKAQEERLRQAAREAMLASGTHGLGGLGGDNFSKGQYKRYSEAYLRAQANASNLSQVERLREMRRSPPPISATEAGPGAYWTRPPATGGRKLSRAAQQFADVLADNGGGGGGVGSPRSVPSGRSPMTSPGASDGVAWYKQPSLGTSKPWSGVTSGDTAFGKSQLGLFPTSSAKARGAANIMKSVGNGRLPAVARSALVLWAAQEGAMRFKEYTEKAYKDHGVAPSDSAAVHAGAFAANLKAAWRGPANNAAQIGIGFVGAVAALSGLFVDSTWGRAFNTELFGSALKATHQWSDRAERFYTGKVTRPGLDAAGDKTRAMQEANDATAKQYDRYVRDFADRNADELAALGFGSREAVRKLVAESEAATRLREKMMARLNGKDEDVENFDGSDGDD